MTALIGDFLPTDEQNLALSRNLGDALAAVAGRIFGPHNTAKSIEAAWGVDRATARNVVKGVVGGSVVTRAIRAQQEKHDDHWDMWLALGELILGESLDTYEERKLSKIIEATENARRLVEARRERRSFLDERAGSASSLYARQAAAGSGQSAGGSRGGDGASGRGDDGAGDGDAVAAAGRVTQVLNRSARAGEGV